HAADQRVTCVGRVEAEDHPHRGGLAGAVWPDEAGDLPRPDGEGHPVQRDVGPEPFAQTTDGDRRVVRCVIHVQRFYASVGVNQVSTTDTSLTPGAWQGGCMRVLVVEDFEVLAETIGTGLRREGMAVDVVFDGHDALEHLAVTRYDVVVLDRDVPGVHGDEICRRLAREPSASRILMLTAASTVRERVD